jgi:hypothetical protein
MPSNPLAVNKLIHAKAIFAQAFSHNDPISERSQENLMSLSSRIFIVAGFPFESPCLACGEENSTNQEFFDFGEVAKFFSDSQDFYTKSPCWIEVFVV